jgi:hypothetical protein
VSRLDTILTEKRCGRLWYRYEYDENVRVRL